MFMLESTADLEAVALAPVGCRHCPRFTGISDGVQALRTLGRPVTEDDIADLAAIACGPCAKRRANVDIMPDSFACGGGKVTRLWLALFPRAGGSSISFGFAKPQQQEPSS
jgi:hypothetical protein